MAVKKSKRLAAVLNLAQMKEDIAAKQLGEVLEMAERSKEQLEMLDQYKSENQQYIRDVAKSSATGSQLQRHQLFLQQIDAAMLEQDERIKQITAQISQAKTNWQQLHYRCKAIGEHVDKIKLEERMLVAKQDQKESDDRLPRPPED